MKNLDWAKKVLEKVEENKKVDEEDLISATEILLKEVEKETLPRYVKNQTELASIFKVDRKTVQRWRKEPGFPKPISNGKWDVHATRVWVKANQRSDPEEEEDLHDLKIRQLKLICEKLEHELQVKRGDYTLNSEVKRQVSAMVHESKTVLLSIPAKIAPIVAGLEPAECEIRVREAIDEALVHLSGG
jgi:phage terminase Nu1 subunit (DNA packaging protein)